MLRVIYDPEGGYRGMAAGSALGIGCTGRTGPDHQQSLGVYIQGYIHFRAIGFQGWNSVA
jgi:hypothetical protein